MIKKRSNILWVPKLCLDKKEISNVNQYPLLGFYLYQGYKEYGKDMSENEMKKKMLEIKGQNQRKDIKGILPTYLIEVLIKNLENNKR